MIDLYFGRLPFKTARSASIQLTSDGFEAWIFDYYLAVSVQTPTQRRRGHGSHDERTEQPATRERGG